nr:MAG TPA: nucelotide kinase [Caudoviricetes sp.]
MLHFTKENIILDSTKENIILDSMDEVSTLLYQLRERLHLYGTVSVAELYDLIGVKHNYTDNEHGWSNIDTVEFVRLLNGTYRVTLPKAERLSKDNENLVSHPNHYQSKSGLEAKDVIEAFTEDLVGIEAVYTGNILKYAMRWKKKNGIQDLEKLKQYADFLIEYLKKEEK